MGLFGDFVLRGFSVAQFMNGKCLLGMFFTKDCIF